MSHPSQQRAYSDKSIEIFAAKVQSIILNALPLGEEHVEMGLEKNVENNVYVLSCKAPLHYGRGLAKPEECDQDSVSKLYRLDILYKLQADRDGKYLTVQHSQFSIRVHTQSAIKFEYERNKTHVPAAHIHFSGIGGLLSPALMKNGRTNKNDRRKDGDIRPLHVPVGGHRFRPSLEEFLYFVIQECGFTGNCGWESKLKESRESWFDIQLRAAVRDHPEVAAKALEALGFQITEPEGGFPEKRRHNSW